MARTGSTAIPVERTYPGVITFAANQQVTFPLSISSIVEELQFQLSGVLTLAGYTAPPTIRAEAPENIIYKMGLNGNAVSSGATAVNLSSVDAAFLRFKTMITESLAPTRVMPLAANGAQPFSTNFTKYFGATMFPKLKRATYLDSRLMQSLGLAFTFRDVNSMVVPGSGTAGNATLTSASIIVHSREWQSTSTANRTARRMYLKESQREFDLTNVSGVDRPFPNIPVGGVLARQTFKGCVGVGVDYADPSDAIFATTIRPEGPHIKTNVIGQGGTATPFDVVYSLLQQQNRHDYSLPNAWPVGYAVYEPAVRTRSFKQALQLNSALSANNTADITPVTGQQNTLWITDEQLLAN